MKEKYLLDEKLLDQIETRAKTPNGDPDMNMLIPLMYSLYGHIREVDRNIYDIKENPVVSMGKIVKRHPALSSFIGLLLLYVVVQLHDPAHFISILTWFGLSP